MHNESDTYIHKTYKLVCYADDVILWYTNTVSSPGERGKGSNLPSCLLRGVAVSGDSGEGRRGDSKRACPRPESSES